MPAKADILWRKGGLILNARKETERSRAVLTQLSDQQLLDMHAWLTNAAIDHHYQKEKPLPLSYINYQAGSVVLSRTTFSDAQEFNLPCATGGNMLIQPLEPTFIIHMIPFFESSPSNKIQQRLQTMLLLLQDAPLLMSQIEAAVQAHADTTKFVGTTSPGLRELALRIGFRVSQIYILMSSPVPFFAGFPVPKIDVYSNDSNAILKAIQGMVKSTPAFTAHCEKRGITVRSARINAISAFPLRVT